MKKPLISALLVASAGALFLPGCGSKDEATVSYECYRNDECGTGSECSGGSCLAVVTCGGDEDCGADGSCLDSTCRTHCTTNAGCDAENRQCDTTVNLCLPEDNPTPAASDSGTGGSKSGTEDLGTGGTDSSTEIPTGTGGSSEEPATPAGPTYDLIDDFEDGDITIEATDQRIGYWYTYNEGQARPLSSPPVASDESTAIHATGSHTGTGASNADEAYGGLGVDFNNENLDMQQPRSSSREKYDGSAWDGFQFRIKGGPNTKSIRFEVVTQAVANGDEGGTCNGDGCFDAHGRDIPLSTTWTTVKVPYSTLVQEGWGAATSFDSQALLGIAFEDLTTQNWDFWVDDLQFYKEAPGGSTGGDGPTNMCEGSWGAESNGSITWYTFDQGTDSFGDVNCSFGISVGSSGVGDKVNGVNTGSGTYFGAINTADYNQAATCGACVEVTRGDKKVVVTVVDQCPIDSNPKCVKGHIDLSKAAFTQLAAESEGYVGQRAGNGSVSWKYVSCPTAGPVTFRLKEPDNANWNMVIVENHAYPIASVRMLVGSEWVNASRAAYNFWLPPGGRIGTEIEATDINGNVVKGSIPSGASPSSAAGQFVCQ